MKINDLSGLNFYQPNFFRLFVYSGLFFIFLLTLGLGCTSLKVTRAFDGEFNKTENNRLINGYCTSCHNHKEFDSDQHLLKVRQKYKRKVFRLTSECRVCHYIEKSWANDHTSRKTRGPIKANKGIFRKFEKKYLKSLGKV